MTPTGAEHGHPDGEEVQARLQAVPAEEPQAQEGRLEEEREQRLDGQRGAEDVADEAGVVRPVHAELELLHDAGGHAHDEVDEEELAEELRELQIHHLARAGPHRLPDRDREHETQGDRHEQEVVDRREAELPSRQDERIEKCFHVALRAARRRSCAGLHRDGPALTNRAGGAYGEVYPENGLGESHSLIRTAPDRGHSTPENPGSSPPFGRSARWRPPLPHGTASTARVGAGRRLSPRMHRAPHPRRRSGARAAASRTTRRRRTRR